MNLKKLIGLIDETQWTAIDVEIKADAYEGLLQKYPEEEKGAGQYFTPREADFYLAIPHICPRFYFGSSLPLTVPKMPP